MAIGIGDVVWLNAGHGPYTVTAVSTALAPEATLTNGNAGSLQTVPVLCLTKKNPTPRIEYEKDLLKNSYLATGSSTVGS